MTSTLELVLIFLASAVLVVVLFRSLHLPPLLGYLLAGIVAVPQLAESLVFKGGTCLRKAYFPGYRFSETTLTLASLPLSGRFV